MISKILLLAVLVGIGVMVANYISMPKISDAAIVIWAGPHVRGSGVLLNDGSILTAEHVVAEQGKPRPNITANGRPAKVEWSSAEYDLALISSGAWTKNAVGREVSCRTPPIGEEVIAVGFPGLETTPILVAIRGMVASKARRFAKDWREAIIINGVYHEGISGAGVIDQYGRVVGIAAGALGDWARFLGAQPMFIHNYGLSVAVPGSVICRLLKEPPKN